MAAAAGDGGRGGGFFAILAAFAHRFWPRSLHDKHDKCGARRGLFHRRGRNVFRSCSSEGASGHEAEKPSLRLSRGRTGRPGFHPKFLSGPTAPGLPRRPPPNAVLPPPGGPCNGPLAPAARGSGEAAITGRRPTYPLPSEAPPILLFFSKIYLSFKINQEEIKILILQSGELWGKICNFGNSFERGADDGQPWYDAAPTKPYPPPPQHRP